MVGATEEQIIKVLRATGGFQTQAAKKLGITQSALSQRIKKRPKLQAALAEIRESLLDLAESKLIESVQERESWAICFYLKCKGKDRGYVEKVNVVAEVEKPIEVIFKKA